jgi:transposase-like protein
MRPRCPVCNSIQTRLSSSNSILLPFTNYKCKNCGHNFILREQNKAGCLWSILKYTLSAICLGSFLLWLFK